MSIGLIQRKTGMMTENDDKKQREIWRRALTAINLGWEMALPIFLGVLLGNYLDKLTNSEYNLTISLLVAGIFLSYFNLMQHIKKINRENTNNENDRDK